jgi:hypothetical protein
MKRMRPSSLLIAAVFFIAITMMTLMSFNAANEYNGDVNYEINRKVF